MVPVSQPPADGRPVRADAARSRARILQAAQDLVHREGATVSADAIARAAGVGSATLYRHFPTRADLLESLFVEQTDALCAEADRLGHDGDASAVAAWLHLLIRRTVSDRGLAATALGPDAVRSRSSCSAKIAAATERLVERAAPDGLPTGASAAELLVLVGGIVATQPLTADPATADRLLGLTLRGALRSEAQPGPDGGDVRGQRPPDEASRQECEGS